MPSSRSLLACSPLVLALLAGCSGEDTTAEDSPPDTAGAPGQSGASSGGQAGRGGQGGAAQGGVAQGGGKAGQGGQAGQTAGGTAGQTTAGAAGQGEGGTESEGGAAGDGGGVAGDSGAAGDGEEGGAAGATGGKGGSATGGAAGKAGAGAGGKAGAGGSPAGCTTRITYGKNWNHGPNHPEQFDTVSSQVTWDGKCVNDGADSYAVLSNGWKPSFKGHGCTIALDYKGSCSSVPKTCSTRVAYGTAWDGPANHPNFFDDVTGRVFSEGECVNDGNASFVRLSNGWEPHFQGKNACSVSFVYEQCGGLYDNAVLDNCADPGVLRDGNSYVLACTGGDSGGTYVIRTSPDLVHWKKVGHIFPNGKKPAWADGSYWAPEIHKVGDHYVAYFSARHKQSGRLAIGAASAPSATGPFKDLGKPLVLDGSLGMIDVSYFEDDKGTPYLLWKADGNAVGKPTPIYGQKLAASGLSLVGSRTTLLSNTLGWEGPLVEGPWMVRHGGKYFLFYSGNAYYNEKYAVGVARSDSPLGPFTKKGAPIVTTDNGWVGPGHNSVVVGPGGEDYLVYHAWAAGNVNGDGDSRLLLVDQIVWSGGWPTVPQAPSRASRPMP